MIRYPVTSADLYASIEQVAPGWTAKAKTLKAKAVSAGKFPKNGSTAWSDIRAVFVELQHRKCAFCERDMAAFPLGGNEQAVEHYRPKGRTRPWDIEATDEFWNEVGPSLGDGREGGYYWLAYDPENYVTACATCNSRLKSDYFPIFGNPGNPNRSPRQLRSEKAAVPFPVGNIDEDPEAMLTFRGIVPVPAANSGHAYRRALVTIRFFALDTREELLEQRARAIQTYFICARAQNDPDPGVSSIAVSQTQWLVSPRAPHSSCVKAFATLQNNDPNEAAAILAGISDYLVTRG